jgi:hypothetical protein
MTFVVYVPWRVRPYVLRFFRRRRPQPPWITAWQERQALRRAPDRPSLAAEG